MLFADDEDDDDEDGAVDIDEDDDEDEIDEEDDEDDDDEGDDDEEDGEVGLEYLQKSNIEVSLPSSLVRIASLFNWCHWFPKSVVADSIFSYFIVLPRTCLRQNFFKYCRDQCVCTLITRWVLSTFIIDYTDELICDILQDDSEGEDFEPGEVDDEDEEIEDGDGNVQFIINKKNTRGF